VDAPKRRYEFNKLPCREAGFEAPAGIG